MFEVPATYFGLRGFGYLTTTYVAAAIMLVLLYPACRWYRDSLSTATHRRLQDPRRNRLYSHAVVELNKLMESGEKSTTDGLSCRGNI